MQCGYGLSRRKQVVKDKSKTEPHLRCDKGGIKRGLGEDVTRQRHMAGCQFEIRLHRTEYDKYSTWQVESAAQHAQHRRPNNVQKALI